MTDTYPFGGTQGYGIQGDAFAGRPPVAVGEMPPVGNIALGGGSLESGVSTPNRRISMRKRIGVAALVVGSAILSGVVITSGESTATADAKQELAGAEVPLSHGETTAICEDDMFTAENPFANVGDVLPGDLRIRPEQPLTDNDSFLKYSFGSKDKNPKRNVFGYIEDNSEKGTLCLLPSDLAVYVSVFNNYVGRDGTGVIAFGGILKDVNALKDFYATHPDEAVKMFKDQTFQDFMRNIVSNEETINSGAYFAIKTSGENNDISELPVQLPAFGPGEVLQLRSNVFIGDDPHNTTDRMLINKVTGQIFVLESLGGAKEISPETTTTTSTPEAPEGTELPVTHDQEGNAIHRKVLPNGTIEVTVKDKDNNTVSTGTIPAGTTPTGSGPGAGPNGTAPGGTTGTTPGIGGGNTTTPGGNTPGTTSRGPATSGAPRTTNPAVTQPPHTSPQTTQAPPTTKKPPVTVPPTLPPTTKPKGSETTVTSPGGGTAPN